MSGAIPLFLLYAFISFGLGKKTLLLLCVFRLLSVGLHQAKLRKIIRNLLNSFGGREVACWPLVPKLAGSNPAEAVGFFMAKKSPARLPFGREVKAVLFPCRRFAGM
jgi:hypothetical protein